MHNIDIIKNFSYYKKMALNILNDNDSTKLDNWNVTVHKKINKLPLISLMNKKNFRLTNNKKGKLWNKPIFSGFSKNQLSSIPRDVEIILLDKKKDEIFTYNNTKSILKSLSDNNMNFASLNSYENNSHKTFNDNNRITPFVSKILEEKNLNPISTNLSLGKINSKNKSMNEEQIIKTGDNYLKKDTKKELNRVKIKNKFNRVNNDKNNSLSLDLFKSQFYPGPTDYSSERSFDMLNQQNKYRYKSLFKSSSFQGKKNSGTQSPGPGSYIQLKNFDSNNDKQVNINIGTKEKRFKNLFSSASLSPWYYSSSSSNNIIENKNIKGDLDDYKHYVIKEELDDKGKKRLFYIEDKPIQIKKKDIIKKNVIKKKLNKKEENKKINELHFDNLLKKYIIVRNSEKEYEVPGPGQYNIYMGFDKISKDKAIESLQKQHKQENLIPENVLKKFSDNKNNNTNFTFFNGGNTFNKNQLKINNSKSSENIFYEIDNKKASNGTLPFISKQKRIKYQDDILSKHTPGPCYYYNDEPY